MVASSGARNGNGQSSGSRPSGGAATATGTPSMQLDERDRDRERERERQMAYEMAMDRDRDRDSRDYRDRDREHREASAAGSASGGGAGTKRARPLQEDTQMHEAGTGAPPSVKPRLGGLAGESLESRTAGGGASAFPPRPPSRTYAGSPHHLPGQSGRPSSAAAQHHHQQQPPSAQQQQQEPSVLQQVPGNGAEAKRPSLGEQGQASHASSATPAPAPVPAHTGVTVPAHRQKREDWDVTYNKELAKKLEVSLVHTFVHDSVVCCVRLSPDGKLLATGCNRNTTLYDTKTGQRIVQLVDPAVEKPDNYIRSVAFSPDGRTIATGSEDHQVRLWDIAFGKMRAVLSGHRQEIYSLAFTPDGSRVISGSGDRSAIIWNVETGKIDKQLFIEEPPRHTKPGDPHDAGVTSVAVSADGKFLVAGSLDHNVRIWDIATGKLLDKLKGHKDSVYSVAFIPGGKQILTGSLDKTLKIWEIGGLLSAVEKGETIDPAVSRCRSLQTLAGHKDFVLSVAATPDGQYVISGSKDRAVNCWSPKDETTQFVLHGHKNSVISIAMSETNGLLATGSGDWQARIFRIDGLGAPKVTSPAQQPQPQAALPASTAPVSTGSTGSAADSKTQASAATAPPDGQSKPKSPIVAKQEETAAATLPAAANGSADKAVSASIEAAPAAPIGSAMPSKSGSTASSSSAAAAAASSKAASTEASPAPAPAA